MMESSSHRPNTRGTGTSVFCRASRMRYSRSTLCAVLLTSFPGGFLRKTNLEDLESVIWYVGLL